MRAGGTTPYVSKTAFTPVGYREVVPLTVVAVLILGLGTLVYAQQAPADARWGALAYAQRTPADDQYGSPTATAAGNLAPPGSSVGEASQAPTSTSLDLLGVGLLGLPGVFAGVCAALYAAFRVRPGLSMRMQRRALSFLTLGGLLVASAELLYALRMLLSAGGETLGTLGTCLALGHFTAGTGVAVCLVVLGNLLRRSELAEIGPLRRSANLDPFFRRVASRRVARARRSGAPLSLAVLSVDDFEEHKGSLGREAGDTVLSRVEGILKRSIRADDLAVARYGSEEFVALLSSDQKEAEEALERIRSRIEDQCSQGDGPTCRQVTVSIGVTALADRIQTLEGLIEAADEAMYRAREAGKNRVVGLGNTA